MDENGTETGSVDAPIPVTESVDASCYENVSSLDPQTFCVFPGCGSGRLLVAVALGLGLVAFGSVSVAPGSVPRSVPFRFGGVQLRKKNGHRPQNRQ